MDKILPPVTAYEKTNLQAGNHRYALPARVRDAESAQRKQVYGQLRAEEASISNAVRQMDVRKDNTHAHIREGMSRATEPVHLYNAGGIVKFLADSGKGHIVHTIA